MPARHPGPGPTSPSRVAALPSHSAAGAVARDLEAMAERTGETRRRTTRRPRGCSKHAFAPSAQFRPRIKPAGNVTLPAQGHNRAHPRGELASGTSVAGDDPVNNSDPSGLCLNSKGINVGGACSAAQLAAQHQQLLQAEAQMRAADAAAAACTNAFTCAINDPAAVAASFNANRSTIITNVAVVAAAGAVVLTAGAATPLVAEAAGTAFVAGDVTGDFVAVSAMTDGAASLTSAGTAFGYVSLGAGFVGTANACLPQLGGSFGATCALNAGATAIGVGAAWAGGIGGALAGLFSSPAGYFNLDQTQCQG